MTVLQRKCATSRARADQPFCKFPMQSGMHHDLEAKPVWLSAYLALSPLQADKYQCSAICLKLSFQGVAIGTWLQKTWQPFSFNMGCLYSG